jgi:hypothetical protein
MNKLHIEQYNDAYRITQAWLAKQSSYEAVEQLSRSLSDNIDNDAWRRGHCNALADWLAQHEAMVLEVNKD